MELLRVLKDYVPLFQSILWAGLILAAILLFRPQVTTLLARIAAAQRLKLGIAGGSIEFEGLPVVNPDEPEHSDNQVQVSESRSWIDLRHEIERSSREIYLVHALWTAEREPGKYYIHIYLKKHRGDSPHDKDYAAIAHAEFFLGRYWQNRVFKVRNEGKLLGIATWAYGPVLAVCRITFKDGHQATVSRYIDFEMGQGAIKPPDERII